MHVRRTHAKRTHNTFQQIFKSQNKSLLRKLRFLIIGLCILLITSIIIYQIYSLRQGDIYHKSNNKYQSPLQSFMDPNVKMPKNNNLKQQNIKTKWKNKNDVELSLSKSMIDNLYSEKVKPSELQTSYANEYNIKPDLIGYTQLSWEEECESSTFKSKHYYNSFIDENKIDFIFPENDKELYQLFHSVEFLNHWDISFLFENDNYWNLANALDSDSEKDIEQLKKQYIKIRENKYVNKKEKENNINNINNINKYFDFNGLTSDLVLFDKNTKSLGLNGDYWYTSHNCVEHKSCQVYPIHRILSKSKIISCKEILTEILPSIYKCIHKNGKKCENIIDSGYYRIIMKTYYSKLDEEIVIKMMKPRSIKKERDYIRHIRESILLGHLYELENKYIISQSQSQEEEENNNLFIQSLNNGKSIKKRGFNYVEEYGHCVTPLWISISPLYKMALDKWILNGYAKKSKLQKLIFMSLQIAYSVELLHTIPGGPYHHTDIQPRQFLLDDNDNVYINDFNRGKFQPYYFNDNDNDKIVKCWYCGHRSRGHWRAPEEPKKKPLNEKLDIFSMGLTIWALYSNDIPFRDAAFDELTYIYYDLRRIPPMTTNIPPAIKDIIISCLRWDPRQRPTASQIVNMFENIYYINLDIITEGVKDVTSQELLTKKWWTDTNYPEKKERQLS